MSKINTGILLTFLFSLNCAAQKVFVYTKAQAESDYIGNYLGIREDDSGHLTINDIKADGKFSVQNENIPNLGFTDAAVWVKLILQNQTSQKHLLLKLKAPLIDEAELFTETDPGNFIPVSIGQNKKFAERKYRHTDYLFDIYLDNGETKTYYLRVKSYDKLELPITVTTPVNAFASATSHNFLFGIYAGIMIIMIFYNLFIYFSIRDKSYLYYVLYILSVMLTQATFQGYTFRFLWFNSPGFEVLSIQLMSVFVGFASVQFLRVFLQTSVFVPKLDRFFKLAFVLYTIIGLLVISGFYQITWVLILALVSPLSMFMLFVSIRIARMGYRPARYFSVAWSIFLVGVFIYAMKDFAILPHNNFTIYTMPVGSAIETVLLSFALADKINILKMEKEKSQQEALHALKENERIIKQQNVLLEEKVKERTSALEASNHDLKEMQSQLVNSEKMASLGQLTAGIAHEINNPINSVYGNIRPLKRDITHIVHLLQKYGEIKNADGLYAKLAEIENFKEKQDVDYLLKEIDILLNGIDEGAKRTTEIVKGLKIFARLDEPGIKRINIIDGLGSTLLLLKNNINKEEIEIIEKHERTPLYVDCVGGQINQVFMNILNNAVQALSEVKAPCEKRKLEIITYTKNQKAFIHIKDNGPGIPGQIKEKIFDPFFTTKKVGVGTGLGLSISFNIIKSHRGDIEVLSEEGKGSEFIVSLPLEQPQSA